MCSNLELLIKCKKCGLDGYLQTEKPRLKKPHTRKSRHTIDWSTMKPIVIPYKPYPDSRVRHAYSYCVHNFKENGKRKTRRCYLGIASHKKDITCSCNYCNP